MASISFVLNIVGSSLLELFFVFYVKQDSSFAESILNLICCVMFAD